MKSKIKNLIVGIIRLIPFFVLFIMLLDVFRVGIHLEEQPWYDEINLYLEQWFMWIKNNLSIPMFEDFADWVSQHIFGNGIGYPIVMIGAYELCVSLSLLLYNCLSFIVNVANQFIRRFEEK